METISKKLNLWIYGRRIVYNKAGMEQVKVRKDLTYKTIGRTDLKLDVYYANPTETASPPPTVVIVHGNAEPNILKYAKDWGHYVSWAQLLATAGFNVVVFNHRALETFTKLNEVASDLQDAIDFIRQQATTLNLNKDQLGILAFSAGVPLSLRLALRPQTDFIRCIVAYYGPFDLRHLEKLVLPKVKLETLQEFSPLYWLGKAVKQGQTIPAVLVVKAGLDSEELNQTTDRFVQEADKYKLKVELVEFATGKHSFDLLSDTKQTRDIIKQTVEFIKQNLTDLTDKKETKNDGAIEQNILG